MAKLVEVMEFQLSYFKSCKMMLWKHYTQYASKCGKLSSGHRTGKGQFSFQSQRKAMLKNVQTVTQLHLFHKLAFTGEGNGNPLQYSCLETPMDGGAGWAAVRGVAKSQTQLSDFTFTLLWDWDENWPFQVWPLLNFPNFLACCAQYFHSIIFQNLK